MRYIFIFCLSFFVQPAWAENLTPLYSSPLANMTYPSVAGEYLVYTQRVNQEHQIMRLHRTDLYGTAKDISTRFTNEVVRNGVALSNGDIAYVSNRLGHVAPWLSHEHQETTLATGAFQALLVPNHLDVSAQTWVFDSTLETTRTPRIINQFTDQRLHHELLGQAWRMYHSKLWTFKSSYPQTQQGLSNRFQQAYLFSFQRGENEVSMLSDGFDASLSQDGKRMVFVRETNGNFDLWLQNSDGSGLKQLTTNTYADVEPSLSPDGKRVVFVSNRNSRGDVLQTFIHTLDIASGKVTTITSGLGVIDGGPAWLDDNTIIFHSNRDPKAPNTDTVDNWRLWTVPLPKSL
ncbi:MAG TPA: hypothetical protein EYP39_05745 [Ghiorsea sp.]|nr:hypothetical protein [Ghiorsea sp.]